MSTQTRSIRLLFAAFGFMPVVLAMPAAVVAVRAQTVTGTMQGTITDQSGGATILSAFGRPPSTRPPSPLAREAGRVLD
ncbi:MAG TPA: hypothetical protein VGX24_10115 [Pyrinomonadaceae bacterium]|nr:hypothetical protein [Pyrinomonadaceae bacterium]